MSFSFLIVLPKLMRSGVAPAASACSISATDAVSKHEPKPRQEIENLGRRIGLHRIEHARVGQGAGEAQIILAHDVEIDDETRPVFAIAGEEVLDAVRHERLPQERGSFRAWKHEGFAGDAPCTPRVGDAMRSR